MPDERGMPTRGERLEQCKRGFHYYAPPRGIDGMRWCYGCGKTVDPDRFLADAVGGLILKTYGHKADE